MNEPGRGINGGLTQRQGPAPERGAAVNGCNVVIGVEGSVDALYQRGLDLGGSEALPLGDMEGVGRIGYLLDPDGNVFGLISPVLSDGRDMTSAM
jgi:predicted enzyme related to lactoylglutathione lyase